MTSRATERERPQSPQWSAAPGDDDEDREPGEERPGGGRGRRAAASADGNNVKANYTKYEYMIPMRDGVRLFTAVYVPKDTSEKYPIPDGPHAV